MKKFFKNLSDVVGSLLFLALILYLFNSPALVEWLKDIGVGFLKLVAAFAIVGVFGGILATWVNDDSEENDDWRHHLLEHISRYFPLKFIASIPLLVFNPEDEMRKLRERRFAWLSGALLLFASISVTTGIAKLVDLPPTTLSAAAAIYLLDDDAFDPDLLLEQIGESVVDPNRDSVSEKLFNELLPLRMTMQPESEVYSAVVYPGLSVLNVYLEWTYGLRSASDIKQYFDSDPNQSATIAELIDEWQQTRFLEKLLIDSLLLVFPLAFGLMLWCGVPKLPLRIAVGASFYLFAALVLTSEFVYIVASSFVILAAAEILAIAAWFLVFEMWVTVVLPEHLDLPDLRCSLVGNGAMLLLAIVSVLIERFLILP